MDVLSDPAKKHLVRQSTCPAVITGKDSIPFCIPSYRNHVHDSDEKLDGSGYSPKGQASSLGALNKDLYIVDQYENSGESSDGFFSSSSQANFPVDHVGRVWFSLTYGENSETLVLSLLKARNLRRSEIAKDMGSSNLSRNMIQGSCEELHRRSPSVRLKRKLFAMSRRYTTAPKRDAQNNEDKLRSTNGRSEIRESYSPGSQRKINSLVNIYLLPDKRVFGQAKCKKVDVDPVFVDRFVFQISPSELKSRSLRLVFIEIDEHKRHHVIGHVTRPLMHLRLDGKLSYEDLESGQPLNCKDSMDCIDAEILVSLCYDMEMCRLTVVLLRMKLIMSPEKAANVEQDIELKFSVCGKPVKAKKWKTVKRQASKNSQPSSALSEFDMNESFRFDMKPEEFDLSSLVIHVKSKTSKHETKSCVSLGGYMFARGGALDHWMKMLSAPNTFIQSWHHLISPSNEEE